MSRNSNYKQSLVKCLTVCLQIQWSHLGVVHMEVSRQG